MFYILNYPLVYIFSKIKVLFNHTYFKLLGNACYFPHTFISVTWWEDITIHSCFHLSICY